MKIAIIGSRNHNQTKLSKILEYIPTECTEIISGGASGIDCLAETAAMHLNIKFTCITPDYKKFGKTAPLIRNDTIIDLSDLVLAFWDYKSSGTKYVINQCLRKNKDIRIISIV